MPSSSDLFLILGAGSCNFFQYCYCHSFNLVWTFKTSLLAWSWVRGCAKFKIEIIDGKKRLENTRKAVYSACILLFGGFGVHKYLKSFATLSKPSIYRSLLVLISRIKIHADRKYQIVRGFFLLFYTQQNWQVWVVTGNLRCSCRKKKSFQISLSLLRSQCLALPK